MLILLYCNNLFCVEIQYFISPYFFKNPHSYSINGLQNYKYNLGELLNEAFLEKTNIYKKCLDQEKSDYIVNLMPSTFYNPALQTISTNLKVRVYFNDRQTINLFIKHENQVFLNENNNKVITEHFSKLIDLLSTELLNLNFGHSKIDGAICKIFP